MRALLMPKIMHCKRKCDYKSFHWARSHRLYPAELTLGLGGGGPAGSHICGVPLRTPAEAVNEKGEGSS